MTSSSPRCPLGAPSPLPSARERHLLREALPACRPLSPPPLRSHPAHLCTRLRLPPPQRGCSGKARMAWSALCLGPACHASSGPGPQADGGSWIWMSLALWAWSSDPPLRPGPPLLEGVLLSPTPEGADPWHPFAMTPCHGPVWSALLRVCLSPDPTVQGRSACEGVRPGGWSQQGVFFYGACAGLHHEHLSMTMMMRRRRMLAERPTQTPPRGFPLVEHLSAPGS